MSDNTAGVGLGSALWGAVCVKTTFLVILKNFGQLHENFDV